MNENTETSSNFGNFYKIAQQPSVKSLIASKLVLHAAAQSYLRSLKYSLSIGRTFQELRNFHSYITIKWRDS